MFLSALLASEPMTGEELIKLITLIAVCLCVLAVVLLCVFHKRVNFDTRTVAFGAISIALSTVLSFAKIDMSFGGSITFASMLPVFIFSYVYGPIKGLLVGLIYGMIQFMFGGWLCHPIQLLLDYPLAFGTVALAGVFKKVGKNKNTGIFLGLIVFCMARLLMHFFSGIIIVNVSEWVVEELPIFGRVFENFGTYCYSLVYNALYMVPETAILCAVVGILVATGGFNLLRNAMLKQRD